MAFLFSFTFDYVVFALCFHLEMSRLLFLAVQSADMTVKTQHPLPPTKRKIMVTAWMSSCMAPCLTQGLPGRVCLCVLRCCLKSQRDHDRDPEEEEEKGSCALAICLPHTVKQKKVRSVHIPSGPTSESLRWPCRVQPDPSCSV